MDLRTSSGDLARFPRNPTHGGVTVSIDQAPGAAPSLNRSRFHGLAH